MKISFLLSVALGIAMVVMVFVLWTILAGMGVFDQINGVIGQVVQDGSSADIELNRRATGPDLATIRRTPRRVCVVAGEAKVVSVRGALAAGLVTDLILDEGTARALLAS